MYLIELTRKKVYLLDRTTPSPLHEAVMDQLRSRSDIFPKVLILGLVFSFSLLSSPSSNGQSRIRFASVADYGTGANERAVADLIASWNPDFVITQGDNNYTPNNPNVSAWDYEVGQFYGQFIRYPSGSTSQYAPGPATNRFFPALGNHDWDAGIIGWSNYFDLPGNERYYDFQWGPVQFFAIDSDWRQPDGNTSNSTQALWLRDQLAASTAVWKIVYFHHPPYTSASRGNNTALQWPFEEWGATVVLAGHEHHYERIIISGFPYIVNGAGGKTLYPFSTPISGSVIRYNETHGAMLVTADSDSIVFEFYSVLNGGTLIDRYRILSRPTTTFKTLLIPRGSVWKYLDNNSDQGTTWRAPSFNDESWSSGPARLGFGGDGEVTVINGGPPDNRFITTYFRHTFHVTNPELVLDLDLDVLRDDGAVVYLNGAEVWRTNMPAGTIGQSTLASSRVWGEEEQVFFLTSISPLGLITGFNVMAVEVHQHSPSSNDLGFDLRLVAHHSVDPLPIQLGSFTATVIEPGVVQLDWMTLTETNNYGFEVQKSPVDPSSYATIPNSFIPGHGTTLEPQYYRYVDRFAGSGVWYYRLRQIDLDGTVHYTDGVRVDVTTSVKKNEPAEFHLKQNYPNPFNPSTSISFSIPRSSFVVLKVFNTLGMDVTTLVNKMMESGTYEITWDAAGLSSGVYFYKLIAGRSSEVKKMVLIR